MSSSSSVYLTALTPQLQMFWNDEFNFELCVRILTLKQQIQVHLAQDRLLRYKKLLNYLLIRYVFNQLIQKQSLESPVNFTYTKMGKPQFPGIEFNISSSNLVLGLGVSQNQRPIGIDLSHEQQRIDPHSIVDQFRSIMSDDEVDQLESMSDVGQRYLKFNHLWTLKEAYSKYLALGLNMDLASCSFEMGKLDDTENKFPPESETEVLPLHVNWTQLFLQTQTQKCHSCVVKPPINPDRLPVILSVVHDESHPAKVYYIDMFIVVLNILTSLKSSGSA